MHQRLDQKPPNVFHKLVPGHRASRQHQFRNQAAHSDIKQQEGQTRQDEKSQTVVVVVVAAWCNDARLSLSLLLQTFKAITSSTVTTHTRMGDERGLLIEKANWRFETSKTNCVVLFVPKLPSYFLVFTVERGVADGVL